MSSCEDFKQALRNGNLAEAFLVAMSQAPELHITTWIANPKSAENSDPDKPRAGKCLRTYINLVEGEIINEVGSELMQDRFYTQLQQFHLQQATQGHQTIEQNLQSLQKMFRLMATFQQRQGSEKLTQSGWLDSPSSSLNSSSPKPFLEAANTIEAEEEEEDSAVFNDIISLADLDVDSDSELPESEIRSPEEEDWGNWLEEDEQKSLKNLKTDFLKFNSTIKPDSETGEEEEEWEEWEATEFLASNTPVTRETPLRDRES